LFKFKILLTAIVALLLFLFSDIISVHIFNKPLLALPLKIGAVYLFVMSLKDFFSSIFYAVQKINYNAAAELIFQVLRIILVVLFLQFYKNVSSVFVALAIALFISAVFLYFALSKRCDFMIKGRKEKLEPEERRRLLGFFGWLTISSISLIFFMHIDTFMLGIFLPAEFVGYYNAIVGLVGTAIALVSFSAVLLPTFTQLEKGKLGRGFRKVFHYTSMIAIPAAIGLAFVAVPAVQFIFGHTYVPQQYRLAITIAAALLSFLAIETALTAVYASLFQAKEKPKIPSVLILMATAVNIILNYVFIKIGISMKPEYGLIAVALATVIARYGNLMALACLTKKEFKMKTGAGSVIKPLISSLVMLGFLFAFARLVALNVWTGIAMVVLAVLVYFGVMLLIKGIKKEDFELLKNLNR
jgi:O-antigen/teichoic acid export membrane protein